MKRLFFMQQLHKWDEGKPHIFDGEYSAKELFAGYNEWEASFPKDARDKIKSGEWRV